MSERKLFLSYHFATDRDLAASAAQLIEAFDYRVITGEDLGGGPLRPEVKKRIEACDGLVAIVTRGDKKPGKKAYHPHPWVIGELGHAQSKELRSIAVADEAVVIEGLSAEHERIPLDARGPLTAFLRLARTVALWRREAGRTVKVLILPDELALKLQGQDVRCEYRFHQKNSISKWQEAYVHQEIGGTCAYLEGVKEDDFIELRVRLANETWSSLSAPQWVKLELKKGAA